MGPWHRVLPALCVAIVVALSAGPSAQTSSTTSLDTLLQSAEQLLTQGKGFQAQPLFEQALGLARAQGREPEQALARVAIAEILYYRTQYTASRDEGLRALEIYERLKDRAGVGRANQVLSIVEGFLGNRDAAVARAERAVAAYESGGPSRGRAVATLQLVRVKPMDLTAQQVLYERIVADARTIGDRALEGNTLHSLGDHFFVNNQFEAALDALLQAEAVLRDTPDENGLGTVYNSLGRLYRAHGRFDEALRFQLKALALHEKTQTPFELMQSLNAVATVYQRVDDLQDAERYYERALAIAEASSSQRVQDLVRANLASLLSAQGQFARAAAALEQVIANGLDVYPARRYGHLSAAYLGMGRARDALAAANKSVELCATDESICIDARRRRAAVYAALGDPAAALTDIDAALTTLEDVRARLVPTDFFKQDFNHSQQWVYSLAIALQVREKQERQALETAELARARAFLDLLASRDVQVKDRDRPALASLLASARTPAAPQAATGSRASGLTLRGTTSAPATPAATPRDLELRSLVTASPSAAHDLVATAARLQSTMVVYWVSEDELFIWAVTPKGAIQARRVPVRTARLLELIRETTPFDDTRTAGAARSIVARGESTIPIRAERPTAWRSLYDLLIQPIRSALPTTPGALLTIVPQGPLLNVSFAALQNAQGRYLLEDYALHYAPAGAVLQYTSNKRRADARTGPMLVVSDPALPQMTKLDRQLPRLPGARGEAAAIARVVPAGRLTVLQDTAATEARIRDLVAGKAVLHFATHAIVRDDDPFGSFLALGPTAKDGGSDGLLTSQEVYGLDLNADLVVLSACRSAGGSVTGDGISAFARAFIYAGTASLVASLWDVADEPTNRLLPDFYRAWHGGESKSRALRAAQLRLLRDLRAGRVKINTAAGEVSVPEHPVFWAGFALFGEPE